MFLCEYSFFVDFSTLNDINYLSLYRDRGSRDRDKILTGVQFLIIYLGGTISSIMPYFVNY